MSADSEPRPDNWVTTGLTLFFVVSYILVANPLILSCQQSAPHGCSPMPVGSVFIGTCASAGIFSVISGLYAKSPAVLAPGMAFNLYFVQFLSTYKMHWAVGLIACSITGIAVLISSRLKLRYAMVRAIPPTLARAMGGGIGALLSETAIGYMRDDENGKFDPTRVGLFMVGILVIFLLYVIGRSRARQTYRPGSLYLRVFELLGCSAFMLSILLLWALSFALKLRTIVPPIDVDFIWAHVRLSDLRGMFSASFFPFCLFLFYMLTIDIVGSPYELAVRETETESEYLQSVGQRGFMVDGIANALGPLLGTSPIVYYAENHSARLMKASSGKAAILTGSLFLTIGVLALVASNYGMRLPFPPSIAIAPTLFFVGGMVVAETLQLHGASTILPKRQSKNATYLDDPAYFIESLPAAFTIILTPIIGIQFGLAAGIMCFYVLAMLLPDDLKKQEIGDRWAFGLLSVIAGLAILITIWLNVESWLG